MNTIKTPLQDADPLRHEAPRLDEERERMRLSIQEATLVTRSVSSMRARLALASAIAALAVMGLFALGSQVWIHGPSPVLAAVRFEVRLAEERPTPGLIVAQVADSGRLIYLHPEIVGSNDDIAQTSVVEDGPTRFGIAVEFLASGAERMRQATTTHVGRPVAILIDGVVVSAPLVRSPIGESAVISGNYTRAEADRIAEGIARR
jgi:preprotein translocase subunit SecD